MRFDDAPGDGHSQSRPFGFGRKERLKETLTLFFGQAFVVFTNAANPAGITNGSNGLANVDPLTFFGGRIVIDTIRGYYWFLLGTVALLLVVLYHLSESRTGRAWKASR